MARVLFQNENTKVFAGIRGLYGLREIGDRKSWYRWRIPDGTRFRFAYQAIARLDGQQLRRYLEQRKLKERQMEIQAARDRAKMRNALRTLALAWRGQVRIEAEAAC